MDWSSHYPAFIAEGEEPYHDPEEDILAVLPKLEERKEDAYERQLMWEAEATHMVMNPGAEVVSVPRLQCCRRPWILMRC